MESQKSRRRSRWWLLTAIFAVSTLVYFSPDLLSLACGDSVTALGESMEPTIVNRQRLTVDRDVYLASDPERGDIVLLKHAERQILQNAKRVIGLPGETITIEGGAVFVDGVKLEEPYLALGTTTDSEKREFKIPEDSYFVLGDNRSFSADSRLWGPVARDWISAKVLL
jgi:signal peptidase I